MLIGPDEWTTGRLLIASPELDDAGFARAVVLVIDHDEDGAIGVVLNRPSGVPVTEAVDGWDDLVTRPAVLFGGGPVEPEAVVALGRSTPSASRGDTTIVERIQLVDLDTDPVLAASELEDLRVFAGYAGWGPGQLEREILIGAWHVTDMRVEEVFTADPGPLWREVLRRQEGPLALLATYPEDPTLN
jgi:putative transcriptional regulator